MEIRGDETALRLARWIEYALHPLALEDALRPSQRPKEDDATIQKSDDSERAV